MTAELVLAERLQVGDVVDCLSACSGRAWRTGTVAYLNADTSSVALRFQGSILFRVPKTTKFSRIKAATW